MSWRRGLGVQTVNYGALRVWRCWTPLTGRVRGAENMGVWSVTILCQ